MYVGFSQLSDQVFGNIIVLMFKSLSIIELLKKKKNQIIIYYII